MGGMGVVVSGGNNQSVTLPLYSPIMVPRVSFRFRPVPHNLVLTSRNPPEGGSRVCGTVAGFRATVPHHKHVCGAACCLWQCSRVAPILYGPERSFHGCDV